MRTPRVLLLLTLLSAPAFAQDITEGENLFLDYCATCHGPSAYGDGPMSPAMVLQPTNLTMLQSENEGEFPTLRVVSRIDGRDPLVSHGSPMPVFGDFFEGQGVALKTEAGQPLMTSQPVVDLVAWLQSIQE